MTASFTKTIRQAGLVLGFALSFSALSTSSFASEARQACNGDAFRLCSSEIPSIPRITACMLKKKDQVSDGCRMAIERDQAAQRSSKVAAQ